MTTQTKAFVLKHKKQLAWYDKGDVSKTLSELNNDVKIMKDKDCSLDFMIQE